MDPTTNRISLCSGGGSEQFILEFDTSSTANPTGNIQAYAIDHDSDGNFYMCGLSAAEVSGQEVSVFWKVNKTGTSIEWTKNFDYSGHSDIMECVKVNKNESGEPVYVSGTSGNFVTYTTGSYADAQLYKYTSSGTSTWKTAWGGGGYDTWSGFDWDSSNNVYLTGTNYPWQSGIALVKKDSTGATQWHIKKNNSTTESSRFVSVDSNDNVFWGGVIHNPGDAWVGKYTTAGAKTSSWTISSGQDLLYGMDMDASNNLYLMIDNNSSWGSISGYSGTIFQLNQNGNWTWAMVSGGSGSNYGYAVCCDKTVANGDIYGYQYAAANQFGNTEHGVYVIKRSYAGSTQWSRLFHKTNGGVYFAGGSPAIRCDGEFLYISGRFELPGGSVQRPFAIKYPVDGSVTGTFGDWKIDALTSGSNGYYAYDNNYLSSWSIGGGYESNTSTNGSDKTVNTVESTGNMITGDKEILS